jgi:hypothetical protein
MPILGSLDFSKRPPGPLGSEVYNPEKASD